MENIKEILQNRQSDLLRWKAEKEKAIANAPTGTLRICNSGNRTQFYQRIDPTDFNGRYLNEKERTLAQTLAQKDYDKKVLRSIEKELNAIQKYLTACPTVKAEQVYEKMHKERQKLVNPIQESEEEFVRKWERVVYQGKDFYEDTPEFYTMKAERVRSKSEVIIADMLNREGIPYRYEYPINMRGYGIVYPDFTVLNVAGRREIYWEHFGMMDDLAYVEKALQKIATYEKNGIYPGNGLILTYESKNMPMNQKHILRIIKQYL